MPALPSDIDGDGAVQVLDLLALLAAWGVCPATFDPAGGCPADLNGDDVVGITDLLIMLMTYGVDSSDVGYRRLIGSGDAALHTSPL